MFVIEFTTGWFSRSSALMADSLDMFGDAAVYAFSLYVLNKGSIWRAKAGLLKGGIMAVFGVFVFAQALYRFSSGSVPVFETMSAIGAFALAANTFCLVLLYRHRSDDITMRSTWLCSRNDIIANVGVLGASALVGYFNSGLPDVLIGGLIAGLFLKDSWSVIADARTELNHAEVSV